MIQVGGDKEIGFHITKVDEGGESEGLIELTVSEAESLFHDLGMRLGIL